MSGTTPFVGGSCSAPTEDRTWAASCALGDSPGPASNRGARTYVQPEFGARRSYLPRAPGSAFRAAQPFSAIPCPKRRPVAPPDLSPAGDRLEDALIARARAGDPVAERALYDAHVDRIYRLAFRFAGSDDLARDFTQDAFIRAFSRLNDFRGESKF